MEHALASAHRDARLRLLALGESLTAAQAATLTTACPEWSIKDVYAHLAGISTDILSGNTENAATVEWADGHVADRGERSFSEVLAEWADAGAQVDELLMSVGEAFPFQLFIDQWTHEWDVRAGLGEVAAVVPDLSVCEFVADELGASMGERAPSSSGALKIVVGERAWTVGEGAEVGELALDPFTFTRVAMGRRSHGQMLALPWPATVTEPVLWFDALVVWSVNGVDVVDPVLPG